MSMALATRNNDLPTPADWQTMLSLAEHLVASGMLPTHIKTPAAAVAVIQRGRELGIPPSYALSNIVYIQGKPSANSELMLALIYRDHGDNAVKFVETSDKQAVVAYKRRAWQEYASFAFTIEQAKVAGLLSNATWQRYPAAMLRARCISAVARLAFPDSIGGMYTPEELGAAVEFDRDGGFVLVTPDDDDSDAEAQEIQREVTVDDLVDYLESATKHWQVSRAWDVADEHHLLTPTFIAQYDRALARVGASPERPLTPDEFATIDEARSSQG